MISGKAAGIDVITIARIAILYFLSSFIVIRRPPGLYSDHTFQMANCKSFFRLLLVFIVLICPHFTFSFCLNKCFCRGRGISSSHNPLISEGHVLVVTLEASIHTVAVSRPTGIKSAPLEIRRYTLKKLRLKTNPIKIKNETIPN
jgi:hypothetical protein